MEFLSGLKKNSTVPPQRITKRNPNHPEYDEAFLTYITNNRNRIILQQYVRTKILKIRLHRERQRNVLKQRKFDREMLQFELNTLLPKKEKAKSRPTKNNHSMDDLYALKELSLFDKTCKIK